VISQLWKESLAIGFGIALAIFSVYCFCWWAVIKIQKAWEHHKNPWKDLEDCLSK